MNSETGASSVELVETVEGKLKRIQTNSLDLSFNELLDMYTADDQELVIDPHFQRLFVWTEGQRSRFVESLLLELPIPPIYVLETEDGKYSLIDGLQRFSSYLHLRGELDAKHLDPPVKKHDFLELSECDIAPELNGKTFDDLPVAFKIKLKRAFIRVVVIRRQSDPMLQYHMFKRLNTGGSQLTHQQVRNCTVRLISSKFIDFVREMSENSDFQECIVHLSTQKASEFYDEELVLRFFALRNYREHFKHDVADFLTEYMERISAGDVPFDYPEQRRIFLKTFAILQRAMGNRVFGLAKNDLSGIRRGFGVYQFESIVAGVQASLDGLEPENSDQIERFRKRIEAIKLEPDFVKMTTGGGKNSPGMLRERIAFVEEGLAGGDWNVQ